jgi:hypothetical protein
MLSESFVPCRSGGKTIWGRHGLAKSARHTSTDTTMPAIVASSPFSSRPFPSRPSPIGTKSERNYGQTSRDFDKKRDTLSNAQRGRIQVRGP